MYLILGQQRVTNTCEQHHGHQEWDRSSDRHDEGESSSRSSRSRLERLSDVVVLAALVDGKQRVCVCVKGTKDGGMEGSSVSDKHILGSFKLRLVMVWCRE